MSVCSDTSDKWVRVMVFIATFNNISVILWRSVLLVEESRGHGDDFWVCLGNVQLLPFKIIKSCRL
jgi:hypothetical protein